MSGILDRRYELMVDRRRYAGQPKPKGPEMGAIRNRLGRPEAHVRIGIEHLDWAIRHGLTLMPGVCEGGTRAENWKSQQLWLVDFDNDQAMTARGYDVLDPLDALDRAFRMGLDPLFVYFTHKATVDPWNPRYRIVFALDAPVTDRSQAEGIGDMLLRAFPEADQSSCQPERMFLCPGGEVWPSWKCQL